MCHCMWQHPWLPSGRASNWCKTWSLANQWRVTGKPSWAGTPSCPSKAVRTCVASCCQGSPSRVAHAWGDKRWSGSCQDAMFVGCSVCAHMLPAVRTGIAAACGVSMQPRVWVQGMTGAT